MNVCIRYKNMAIKKMKCLKLTAVKPSRPQINVVTVSYVTILRWCHFIHYERIFFTIKLTNINATYCLLIFLNYLC